MTPYHAGIVCLIGMAAACGLVARQLWRERSRVWWTLRGHNIAEARRLPSTVRTEKRCG